MKRAAWYTVIVAAAAVIGVLAWTGVYPLGVGPRPDMTIRAVEITPASPQVGELYTVIVHISNIGDAPSGQYETKEYIRDTAAEQDYRFVGSTRQSNLAAGETIQWVHPHAGMDKAVRYQLLFEIDPIDFVDKNDKNNVYYWDIVVIPR